MNEKERLEEIKDWHENDGELHQFQIDYLIECAGRFNAIQKENAELSILLRTVQSDLHDSQQQNQRYKQALEEIADHETLGIDIKTGDSVSTDVGEIARQALRGDSHDSV